MAIILATLGRIESGVTALRAGQENLEAGLASLESRQMNLESRHPSLESRMVTLDVGQATLRAEMATFRDGLSALREENTALRVGVMERMDRLQNSLTTIRDDIGVNMGRADRAHQAADSTREELRALGDQVNGMIRQITRLQNHVRELRGDP